jgi:hypothetical protein
MEVRELVSANPWRSATSAPSRPSPRATIASSEPGRGDTLYGGAGGDVFRAVDRAPDSVRCGVGRDVVTADRIDRVAATCEVVRRA